MSNNKNAIYCASACKLNDRIVVPLRSMLQNKALSKELELKQLLKEEANLQKQLAELAR